MARRAPFVFVGTVDAVGASNVPEAPARPNTLLASVERVVASPPAFPSLPEQVTVLVEADAQLPEPGARLAFEAESWIYGTGLALRATAIRAADDEPSLVRQSALEGLADVDRDLRDRLAGADLVVTGQVERVRPAEPAEGSGPVSEHDPEWQEASVRVDAVEKGEPSAEIVVAFPASMDVMWFQAPKFTPGTRGTWLLRRPEPGPHAARLVAAERPLFTALDPLDFRPEADAPRIRALVQLEAEAP